jgi:hypothetical protein
MHIVATSESDIEGANKQIYPAIVVDETPTLHQQIT